MIRSHYAKSIGLVALVAFLLGSVASSVCALTLIAPTEGQTVRENVRIVLPISALPGLGSEGQGQFVSIYIVDSEGEKFVQAVSANAGYKKDGTVTFLWNSKAKYYDPNQPMKEVRFKDGRYTMKIALNGDEGASSDSATVNINLKNRVDRTNPAPAVPLVNHLAFGQINTYGIASDVEIFDFVGLPILGGLGIRGKYQVVQSVEDARPDGQLMIRCRIDEGCYVEQGGSKSYLYTDREIRPQLYRLVTKYGNVVKANVFSKQGMNTIMDVLPVLPGKAVKEGDSWPSAFNLKIEGLTELIPLAGTSQLDSFEWQNGQECAKIVSQMAGTSRIIMSGGKIRSLNDTVNAGVVTYFSYKTGKMLKSEINLEFQAIVDQGTGSFVDDSGPSPSPATGPSSSSPYGYEDDEGDVAAARPSRPSRSNVRPGSSTTGRAGVTNDKKGTVRIKVVVTLEK